MKECSSGSSFRPGIAPKEMEPARHGYVRTKRVGSSQELSPNLGDGKGQAAAA